MVNKSNTHNTDVPDGLVKHGTVMSTNDNQNVISDGRKGKKSKNDVVGGQHVCVSSTKSRLSGGRKCGSCITTGKKSNPNTTDGPAGLVNHGTVTSTNDNQNVISDGHKTKY